MTPVYHGSECLLDGCKEVSPEDPMWCMQCEEGYLMDLDTTQCYKHACPPLYFQVDYDNETYCVAECAAHEYFSRDYFTCIGCEYVFEGCTACHPSPSEHVFCSACSEGLFPANNGVGCTPCQEDEFFFNDVCLKCDTRFPFCKSCIQYPLLDWAPEQCLACYGGQNLTLTSTPEGNTCGCGQDEFVYYEAGELDTAECVSCSSVLNHCLECQTDQANVPFCTHCDAGFFIDAVTGHCVRDSCNQVNA